MLALISLSVGCAAEGDHLMEIKFDPCLPLQVEPAADTTASEMASLDAALTMWNKLGLTHATREKVPGAQRLPVRFEKSMAMFRGVYLDETGELVVNRGLTEPHQRAVVIAHELGHAYGLWHVSQKIRKSVMNSGNLTIEPLPADNDELRANWPSCPSPPKAPAP